MLTQRFDLVKYFLGFTGVNFGKGSKSEPRVLASGWQWCWWHRDFDDLKLLTIFDWWWQNFAIGDIFWMLTMRFKKSGWPKWPKPSPTYQSRHQQISSPTSASNFYITWLVLPTSDWISEMQQCDWSVQKLTLF